MEREDIVTSDGMVIRDGLIIRATRAALMGYYLAQEFDDIGPFDRFVELCREAGTEIVGEE